jgi:hypothetical protein
MAMCDRLIVEQRITRALQDEPDIADRLQALSSLMIEVRGHQACTREHDEKEGTEPPGF